MAFGFKIVKVKFQKGYTIEELFEVIKDTEFAAGKPSLVKHGFATIIAFPALDSHNQVQIIPASIKKQAAAYNVMKAEAAGVENMIKNEIMDIVTDDLISLRSVVGKNSKDIVVLVEETAEQLKQMGL